MPKKTRLYSAWRTEKLGNPEIASEYLNEALNESPEAFLSALRNVAQAHQMKRVAEASGVARESLYRALSADGNPTLVTLESILRVVGLELSIAPKGQAANAGTAPKQQLNISKKTTKRKIKADGQYSLPFSNISESAPSLSAANAIAGNVSSSWSAPSSLISAHYPLTEPYFVQGRGLSSLTHMLQPVQGAVLKGQGNER